MSELTFTLDKERRIRKNNEYRLVYKHGNYEVGRLCVIYRMPVAKQLTRIGFVTGKKVGGAVERNRARRLMKEVYRLNQHAIREGYAIVVVGRARMAEATYEQARKEMMYLFKKSKLLKNSDA
ncbi:ribonuclease P protein component [Veillonella intestinalis]|uniref:ribonuclease P protein component n=1 Tax=Veillonella intestinalis TaxID=2941341 RepID=UPI002041F560|nr:ribonuclease P protein component [Veillonella intestinalis]